MILSLFLGLGLTLVPIPATQSFVVDRAPDWDAVFDRTNGWTGADGIYSIPFRGTELPGSSKLSDTMFVFSDTFWGDVDSQGNRLPGTVMVNNTMAYLPAGAGPDPAAAQFFVGGTVAAPAAIFIPNTPNATANDFYWLKDGIRVGKRTHIFAARMRKDPAPFTRYGVSLLTIPEGDLPPFPQQEQRETPFWQAAQGNFGQIAFGGAILDLGAPDCLQPDGFVYVYGIREDWLNKKVLVSRVPRDQFEDFTQWRIWDGSTWGTDIGQAAIVADRTSTEMSVTQLPDGRFLMVFMLDTIGGVVAIRIAPRPEGPWNPYQVVYTCPPPAGRPVFYYHCKAHPHLSDSRGLLLSVNVNSMDFWAHFSNADIYRPRFLRLRYQ